MPLTLANGVTVAEQKAARHVTERIAAMSPDLLAYTDITNPVLGNHQYLTPGAAGYLDYWGGVPHYYSYDIAGWHVVTIDSTVEFDQLRLGTAQYDWLAADLGINRARCTLVYMHHPRWSVAQGGGRAGLAEVGR